MPVLYTASATATGEGRNGHVRSSDGLLDFDLAVPKEMGGPGGRLTNPEQLFAAGYAACFHNALRRIAARAIQSALAGSAEIWSSRSRHSQLSDTRYLVSATPAAALAAGRSPAMSAASASGVSRTNRICGTRA